MKDFKKILFPVDLTGGSQNTVPCVLAMGAKYNAEIHLLYVGRIFEQLQSIYVPHPSIKQMETDILAGATKKLEEFAEEYFQTCPSCQKKVVIGDTAEEIINYAKTEKMDLIIMGTHGRKGLEKMLFGSVAEKVVRMSPVPVLCVNPQTVSE
ncbi:MAG: universal stress protein [Desulfobacterales bacterium]